MNYVLLSICMKRLVLLATFVAQLVLTTLSLLNPKGVSLKDTGIQLYHTSYPYGIVYILMHLTVHSSLSFSLS